MGFKITFTSFKRIHFTFESFLLAFQRFTCVQFIEKRPSLLLFIFWQNSFKTAYRMKYGWVMQIYHLHKRFCSCIENFVAFETKLTELLHFYFLNLDMSQPVYFLPIGSKTMLVQMPLIILLFGLGSWYCTYSPSILSSSLLCFIFKKYQTRYILRENHIFYKNTCISLFQLLRHYHVDKHCKYI